MSALAKSYETLLVERPFAHVCTITLNRPKRRNALDTVMMGELRGLFQALYVDREELRAIVLTGAGGKAFCAGGDLKERDGMSDAAWRRQHAILEQSVLALMACPLPVIAAVNGDCMGGGLEFALACDFILAAGHARFGFPEARLGIMPGAAGTQNLPRAVGPRRAKEIMMTGRMFSAAEANDWHLVNAVLPRAELVQTALDVANEIAAAAPVSVAKIKQAIDTAGESGWSTGYRFEIAAYNQLVPMADRREGVRAFNEKRKPRFTGE